MENRCYACGQEKPKTKLTAGTIVEHTDIRFSYQPYIVAAEQHGCTQDQKNPWGAIYVIGFKDGKQLFFMTRNLRIVHGYLHIESREA